MGDCSYQAKTRISSIIKIGTNCEGLQLSGTSKSLTNLECFGTSQRNRGSHGPKRTSQSFGWKTYRQNLNLKNKSEKEARRKGNLVKIKKCFSIKKKCFEKTSGYCVHIIPQISKTRRFPNAPIWSPLLFKIKGRCQDNSHFYLPLKSIAQKNHI